MGCSTCGGGRKASPAAEDVYVVTYPDGRTAEVVGLHKAKVESVMTPGAVYSKK